MRRAVIPWLAAALLLLGSSVAGIALANATVFSAGAFVRVYLDALARGDAAAAASVPGVTLGSLGPSAVRSSALPSLSGIRETSNRTLADGTHRITVAWSSRGRTGSSTFDVAPAAPRFGVISGWRFARPPVARLDVVPLGDTRFRIGGAEADTSSGRPVALLVPGAYRVDLRTPVAVSDPVEVLAERPGSDLRAEPEGRAADGFASAVDRAVERATAACAKQTALYPAGCPFGAEVTDRIASTPEWRISRSPRVELTPTATPGVWRAELTGGVAVLRVDVRSLYDGSVESRNIDSPIRGTYRIVVDDDRPVLAGLVPEE